MRKSYGIIVGFILFLTSCASQPGIPPAPESSSSIAPRSSAPSSDFVFPISQAQIRVTKKPFGIHVSPSSSPISPERFTGYHTGEDFETFSAEQDSDVSISAICKGKVRFAGWVKGYGGVLIQQCAYQSLPITVLYGHLSIDSVSLHAGDALSAGSAIGILGKGYGTQTDGERKHLHLAIHRGSALEYRGYVASAKDLSQWINPFPW